ncbi:MAG: homocysteine S-methyltransferase family protein [Clostridia bacterium]|nr:homocysteine S-methyltransferase family protein [Clostridia bacterium]
MNADFRKALSERVLFFDGGMGTQLQAAGLTSGEAPELWSLTHPEIVTAIHLRYLEAGANILCADTFGVNGLKYPASGAVIAGALVTAAVGCAKEAVRRFEAAHAGDALGKEPHFVALDVGPTGKLMAPFGSLTTDQAVDAFGASVQAAVAAGADLVAVETMNDIAEARAAVLAAHEYAPGMPVCATVVFSDKGWMLNGTDVPAAVTVLSALGVDALGLNCSLGPDKMKRLVPGLCAASCVPVAVSPNAGLPVTVGGVTTYPCGPDAFAREMVEVFDAGARILGGCCGTTPDHIRALRAILADRELTVPFEPKSLPALLAGRLHAVDPADGCQISRVSVGDGDPDDVTEAVLDADDDGAEILLLADADSPEALAAAVEAAQSACPLPLILDADADTAADALRLCSGRAGLLVRGDASAPLTALARRYGAVILGPDDLPGCPD